MNGKKFFFVLFTLVYMTNEKKINITVEYDTSLNIISYLNNNYTIEEIKETNFKLSEILLYIFISICNKIYNF
jgi:hypothetical protein